MVRIVRRCTRSRSIPGRAAPALGLLRRWHARAVAAGRAGPGAGCHPVRAGAVRPPHQLEITVEANPGEVDVGHLRALHAAGVNRISLGAQSFDDAELRAIGRNHDAAAIAPAVAAVRQAGFANLTCDLMFGLPGQTRRQLAALGGGAGGPGARARVGLRADHRARHPVRGAGSGRAACPAPTTRRWPSCSRWGRHALAAAGYEPYEVSSYARPGFRAVHNQLYWTQGAYLGLGASAASFRPLAWTATAGVSRTPGAPTATCAPASRAERPGDLGPREVERRAAADLENEALWLALRTSDGVDRRAHQARFGADPLASEERRHQAARCAAEWVAVRVPPQPAPDRAGGAVRRRGGRPTLDHPKVGRRIRTDLIGEACPVSIPLQDLKAHHESLREELQEAASRVIASGRYIQGPEVEALEAEVAAACGRGRRHRPSPRVPMPCWWR